MKYNVSHKLVTPKLCTPEELSVGDEFDEGWNIITKDEVVKNTESFVKLFQS
jgi:hypothetical protein